MKTQKLLVVALFTSIAMGAHSQDAQTNDSPSNSEAKESVDRNSNGDKDSCEKMGDAAGSFAEALRDGLYNNNDDYGDIGPFEKAKDDWRDVVQHTLDCVSGQESKNCSSATNTGFTSKRRTISPNR